MMWMHDFSLRRPVMSRKAGSQKTATLEAGQSSDPSTATQAPTTTISKAEACRKALATGIMEPAQAIQWIKTWFSLDVTAQHFSMVKSHVGRSTRNGDVLDAIETMKPLVKRLGCDTMR